MRDHAAVLIEFLTTLYPRRFGAFRIDAPLAALIKEITDRIAGDPAVSSRSGVTVSVDVGQADWVGTPWIGIHDSRMNSSPHSTIYAGLLISEDFSTLSFMLYHGIKYSVMKYGGRASVAAMQRTYNSVRTELLPMAAQGFELSRERYVLSETPSETLYENATVAQYSISTDALPPDESWSDLLTTLIERVRAIGGAYTSERVKSDTHPIQLKVYLARLNCGEKCGFNLVTCCCLWHQFRG